MSGCPACSSPTTPWRGATAADAPRTRYELDRCPACGTACLADPVKASPALYSQGTYSAGPGRLDWLVAPLRRFLAFDRRRLLGPLPDSARILDVGAGRGRLAADLAARGSQVVAIEPAAGAAADARCRGVDVRAVALEEAVFPDGRFDRVVVWHALEHLEDPAAGLRRIRPWIAPSGGIVIAVPNLASLQARVGGDRWFHQDVPRHRMHLTPAGVRAMLERAATDRPMQARDARPEPIRDVADAPESPHQSPTTCPSAS